MTTQVLPVIHYESIPQALDNAAIAERCGCPGVFLISMDGKDDELDRAILAVKSHFPGLLRVGANYLTLGPLAALARGLRLGVDAVWTDRPGVTSSATSFEATQVSALLQKNPQCQFFGSVAFKYQAPELVPAKAALLAANLGMVATTSGLATGSAPDVTKLAAMKLALGPQPLALASGVSPENAHLFMPYVDYFLVATHISMTPSSPMFSEAKLRALMEVTRPSQASAPTRHTTGCR